jgi:hypothetical protein
VFRVDSSVSSFPFTQAGEKIENACGETADTFAVHFKERALLKWDEFPKKWKVFASDKTLKEQEFSIINVESALSTG